MSISSTFNEQLLWAQIPKAQKRLTAWLYFLPFWDLRALKPNLNREKLLNLILYEKRKCWLNWLLTYLHLTLLYHFCFDPKSYYVWYHIWNAKICQQYNFEEKKGFCWESGRIWRRCKTKQIFPMKNKIENGKTTIFRFVFLFSI